MRVTGSSIVRLLLLLASLAVLPAAAVSVESVEAPYAPKAAAEALRLAPGAKSALRLELGEADAQEIEAVKKANTEQFNKRLQIGVGRNVPAVAQARGNRSSLGARRGRRLRGPMGDRIRGGPGAARGTRGRQAA